MYFLLDPRPWGSDETQATLMSWLVTILSSPEFWSVLLGGSITLLVSYFFSRRMRLRLEDAFYRVFVGLETAINEALPPDKRFEWIWVDDWAPDDARERRWVVGANFSEGVVFSAAPDDVAESQVNSSDDADARHHD